MKEISGFALQTTTHLQFDEAIQSVTNWLKDEGFGILTEINVQSTLKQKLNVDFKPYRILGACNPPYAHQALEIEPFVGVLLPCNVIVWDEGSHRVVAAMDPRIMSSIIPNPGITTLAGEVYHRLVRVLQRFDNLK